MNRMGEEFLLNSVYLLILKIMFKTILRKGSTGKRFSPGLNGCKTVVEAFLKAEDGYFQWLEKPE